MKKSVVTHSLGCLLALTSIGTVAAQGTVPAATGAAVPATAQRSGLDVLKGAWVRRRRLHDRDQEHRPERRARGDVLQSESLPFAKAQARREGAALRVFLELQAGGYAGSTYDLTYDPATDLLKGVYYQAVAKQKFEVYFARK